MFSIFESPSNQKEKLWNDLLNEITKTCAFPKSNGSECKTYLTRLRDTIWYIDGHYTTIQEKYRISFLNLLATTALESQNTEEVNR